VSDGLRERKKVETREQVMYTAMRLFAERGFDQVTVPDIAAEANVSPSTFFRYFISKPGVVFGLATSRLAVLQRQLDNRPPDHSALGVIHAFLCGLLAEVSDAADVFHTQQALVERYPAIAAEQGGVFRAAQTLMAASLAAESQTRTTVENEMIASVAADAYFVTLRVWYVHGGDLLDIFDACWLLVEHLAQAQPQQRG
jgi:AcrR family transcriptional regulator